MGVFPVRDTPLRSFGPPATAGFPRPSIHPGTTPYFDHILLLNHRLIAAGITGLYAIYYLNIAPRASVVLSVTGFFLRAFLFPPRKARITVRIRQWRGG